MSLAIVLLCLAVVVGIYFYNNPLQHAPWFLSRRFINWFPLGMTYSFLYMGRYNLTVAKNALGTLMTKEEFGLIFAAPARSLTRSRSSSTARWWTRSAASAASLSPRSAPRSPTSPSESSPGLS